ncbi:MAG: hypothetical protein LBV04_09705 [Deferribacteraceae bacterium]|jgi:hypothetical protein|nr:hypothetical protein [Deferribacteraceae bacterium]
MGTIQHNALIVTSTASDMPRFYEKAIELFGAQLVSPVISASANEYQSFFVSPSGSKLGWDTYDKHMEAMAKMLDFLDSFYNDTKVYLEYVKVSYGELGLKVSAGMLGY